MLRLILFVFLFVAPGVAFPQSPHSHLRSGDDAYLEQDYKKAEEEYRKAQEKKSSYQSQYNLGNAIYQQQRFDEAEQQFQMAAERSTDPAVKAQAYHNLGNAYYSKQQFKEAIEAYKNALRNRPADMETQYNLSQAMRQLQQQQRQQQEEQQEQEEKQKPPPPPKQQAPPSSRDDKELSDEGDQPQEPDARPGQLTDEEAKRLLDIMNREEQKVQEKMLKTEGSHLRPEKDW